jgi:exodeoxyribonuclease V alpha subunit
VTDTLLGDEQLTGEVVGTYHADPVTGFGVVEVVTDDGPGARCAGPLAGLREGDHVRLVGRWSTHPRHGRTFDALLYEHVTPTTVAGLAAYLKGDRFAEVPEAARSRVLTTFGAGTGRVLEREPDRLVAEAGLSVAEADTLRRAWAEGRALADLVRLVEPVAWPHEVVLSVHHRFQVDAVPIARSDPYLLLEADRARFAHVDRLARHLGREPTDPARLAAGAVAAVTAARRRDGHEHLPWDGCVAAARQLLGVDAILAADGVARAVAAGTLVSEDLAGVRIVTTPSAQRTEQQLAEQVLRLAEARPLRLAGLAAEAVLDPELTPGQQEAIRTALDRGVSVITGGPGTGKTRTVQEMVRCAEDADRHVVLCAPTGRAAKRLEELVGRPATTIHRLLEARPDGAGGFRFRYGPAEQVPYDLVVADEVSMCDTWLAAQLVAAVEDGAHLVLVGDPAQLPSVGPGDVLRDLIASGAVPVTTLSEIHRQAAGSRIVQLAGQVLAGQEPALRGVDGDVFLAEEPDRGRIVPRVVQAVAVRIPDHLGVDPDDVQVLAPVYRGPVGVDALNAGLKAALNPAPGAPAVGGLQVGDRVLQTRNDPERDLANGDVGRVVDLDRRRGRLTVQFPRGAVEIDGAGVRDLTPAWAVTVHKSQGGEWPVVVLVLDRSHHAMLWRNLVYTAITRAERALIVVGQQDALRAAVRQDRPRDRATGLKVRLRRGIG